MDVPLSRDPKCGACGHAAHLLLCDDHGCPCDRPPIPGILDLCTACPHPWHGLTCDHLVRFVVHGGTLTHRCPCAGGTP